MKKYLKVFLTLAVTILVIFSLASCANNSAVKDAEGEWGDFSWSFKKETLVLTIEGSGNMPDANTESDVPWSDLRSSIESIRFKSGSAPITSVGDYAFYGMQKLTKIELDENIKTIGKCAFAFCPKLAEVKVSGGLEEIRSSAFEGCNNLVALEFPESTAKIGARAFAFCHNLESVTFRGEISSIETWTFKDCTSLEAVRCPNTELSASDDAFEGASIEKKDIKSVKTSMVAVICKDSEGNEIYKNPAERVMEIGETFTFSAPALDGYKVTGENTKSVVSDGSDITIEFTYEKLPADGDEKASSETATEPTTSEEPNQEPKKNMVTTIIAIVVFGLVIIAISVGAFLLIRANKKTTKDSRTVRKNGSKKK